MGKYCTRCGAMIDTNAKFCTKCGAKTEMQANNINKQTINNPISNNDVIMNNDSDNVIYTPKTNNVAVGSLICSLVGIFAASGVMGLMAIILGIGAISRNKCTNEKGNGLAAVGIILGIIEMVAIIYIIVTRGVSSRSGIFMNLI